MAHATTRAYIQIRIRIETERVQADLERYRVEMHRNMSKLIIQQMKLLIQDVMKLTPPFGSRAARQESWNVQRRIGQNSTSRDIQRVFVPLDKIAMKSKKFGGPILTAMAQNNLTGVPGKGDGLVQLLQKAKIMDALGDVSHILAEPTEEIHNAFRLSRGRVRGKLPYPYFVFTSGSLKKFIEGEYGWDRIGILKGGWGAGARHFFVSAPQWVSRHFSGDVVDNTGDPEHPFAIVRNQVSYIAEQNADARITLYALQDRAVAMERQMAAYAAKQVKL